MPELTFENLKEVASFQNTINLVCKTPENFRAEKYEAFS